jgi:MFS family permease
LETSDIDCTDDFWKDGCTAEFCTRQDDATVQAGTIMSIPYIISATLSPFLGAFVDKYGCRAIIATIAPATLVAVHASLGYTTVSPIAPLVGQGLSYSAFAAVIWPSVPLVVSAELVGLAYGVITSIQNGGLASFPLIIATIYSLGGDKYIPNVELFFVITAVLGVLVGIYLNFIDCMYLDNMLNKARATEEEETNGGDEDDDFRVVAGGGHSERRRSTNSKRSTSGNSDESERFFKERKSNEFKATAHL